MISINSVVNFLNFKRKGIKIPLKEVSILSIAAIIGVNLSSRLSYLISARDLKLFFALFLLFNAGQILWRVYWNHKKPDEMSPAKPTYWFAIAGFAGGTLAGLTGLGGGAIMVPILLNSLKVSPHQVSSYSNATMIFTGIFGALFFAFSPLSPEFAAATSNELGKLANYQWGTINLVLVALLSTGSTITSRLGVSFSKKLAPAKLSLLFASLLLFTAIRLLINQFS